MARRRSARLRNNGTPERPTIHKSPPPHDHLGSIIERDGTPENGPPPTLDSVLSPTNVANESNNINHLAQLSALNTPKTAPKPTQSEMHPELIHKSTVKPPDSGERLGFRDIVKEDAAETPSRPNQTSRLPTSLSSPEFQFRYVANKNLSQDAQNMRAEIREKASRIKEEMRTRQNDLGDADEGLVSAVGRKIAKPKGKAGRFSDIHMSEFKKMDSIANHPSSFRAQPKAAEPTANPLKRKGSKAGLDEQERPRTARNDSSSMQNLHTSLHATSAGFSKNRFGFPSAPNTETGNPSKRVRKVDDGDVSTARPASTDFEAEPDCSSALPRPKSSSNLFTPTKASLNRSKSMRTLTTFPSKTSLIPRSATIRSVKPSDEDLPTNENVGYGAPTQRKPITKSISMKELKQATTMPVASGSRFVSKLQSPPTLSQGPAVTSSPSKPTKTTKSRLPTMSGFKSILRRTLSRPMSNDPVKIAAGTHVASPSGNPTVGRRLNDLSSDGVQNPSNRRSTLFKPATSPRKRVDFTPSVKDRYDLAAASPSPSPTKGMIPKDVPEDGKAAPGLFDPSAYVLDDPDETESSSETWESTKENTDDVEVAYPTLAQTPTTPENLDAPTPRRQIMTKNPLYSKENVRPKSRNDPGFKSIFTTLKKPSSKASPSTIRRIRETESFPVAAPASPNPRINRNFLDPTCTHLSANPHGLPAKKRRRPSSTDENDSIYFKDVSVTQSEDSDKENRRQTINPSLPGSFPRDSTETSGFMEPTTSSRARSEQPSEERAAKRTKLQPQVIIPVQQKTTPFVSKARKEAAANAKARKNSSARKNVEVPAESETPGKSKGVLSKSRLNLLARPKGRKSAGAV